jgi:hypothetical protein
MVSILAAGLWYFLFFRGGFDVGKSDETALTNTLIPVLAAFHSILAAAVLSKVWEEFKSIRRCVQNKDEAGFFRCLQDRIPAAIQRQRRWFSFVRCQIVTQSSAPDSPFMGEDRINFEPPTAEPVETME